MCDYSLENQISRAAQVGDKLVTCSFPMTPTRSFCAVNEPGMAVCLLPGTELAFESPIRYNGLLGLIAEVVRAKLGLKSANATVARFRQVDLDNPHMHHDALELADGRIIKVTLLQEGQKARVLQLPALGAEHHHHHHTPVASRLREAAREDEPAAY